jgi:hypothetical protein
VGRGQHFDSRARYVRCVAGYKNTYGRGVVGAIRTGFDAAPAGPVLVVMADLSDDLVQVGKMLEHYRRGSHIVVGSRYMKGGRLIGGQWFKQLLSRSLALPCAGFVEYPRMTLPTLLIFLSRHAERHWDREQGRIRIEPGNYCEGFPRGLHHLGNAFHLARPDCGDFSIQALEVVAALSQVVFHGFSAQVTKSGGEGRTAISLSSPTHHGGIQAGSLSHGVDSKASLCRNSCVE